MRGELARGSVGSLLLRLTATGLALGLSVALARILGARGYGIYAYVMAFVMLLSIPAQLGLPTLLIRETAACLAGGECGRIRGLLRRANQGVLAASLLLGLATVAVAMPLRERITDQTFWTLLWGLALLPLLALGALRAAALRGLGRIVIGMLPEEVIRAGLFLAAVIAFVAIFGKEALTPSRAMAVHAAGAAAAFGVGVWLLVRYLPGEVKAAPPSYDLNSWRSSALPLLLLGGLSVINTKTDILMLGYFRQPEDVGVYRVVVTGAGLVLFVFGAVNRAVEPLVSRLHAEGQRERLQTLATLTVRMTFGLTLPIAFALIVFGSQILGTVFGSDFARGHLALAILAVGQLAGVAMGSVVLLLNMTGHERSTVRGIAVAAGLNVLLNATLIPIWGLEGAALATAVTLATWNILLARSVKRRLGVRTTLLGC